MSSRRFDSGVWLAGAQVLQSSILRFFDLGFDLALAKGEHSLSTPSKAIPLSYITFTKYSECGLSERSAVPPPTWPLSGAPATRHRAPLCSRRAGRCGRPSMLDTARAAPANQVNAIGLRIPGRHSLARSSRNSFL